MDDPARDGELRGAYRHASLGMQFAAGTLLFAGLGFLLDRWLNIVPALTVTGLLVGGALSFLSVYRKVIGEAGSKAGKGGKGGKAGRSD
jgi:F0F1-type ATP synthase assembly protein I